MACEWNPCYASCPPVTVMIQPPPFTLNIPGPAIYCPDQPLCIEQCNPCAVQFSEGMSRGGYAPIASSAASSFSSASVSSQKSLPRGQSERIPHQRF